MPLHIWHSAFLLPAQWDSHTRGGRAEQWREEECEEVGLPSLFIWFSCSAQLSSVALGKKQKTKNKNAVSRFRSLSISRFFKSSRKRKKKLYFRAENIAITQQQWAPPASETFKAPSYQTLSWLRQTAHCLWYLISLHFWWNKPVWNSWVRKTKKKEKKKTLTAVWRLQIYASVLRLELLVRTGAAPR